MQGLAHLQLLWLVLVWPMSAADETEDLNVSTLKGTVFAIHKPERGFEFEATIRGNKQVSRDPYLKVHRVVWMGEAYVVTQKAPTSGKLRNGNQPFKLSPSELKKRIA